MLSPDIRPNHQPLRKDGLAQMEKNPTFGTDAYPYARPKTFEFLKSAIEEDAHLKVPKNFGRDRKDRDKEDLWIRMRNVAGIYYSCDVDTKDIASMYGVNHQMIAGLIRRFVKHLWENSSEELRKKYPLKEVLKQKSPTEKSRRQRSNNSFAGSILRQLEQARDNPVLTQSVLDQINTDLYRRLRGAFATLTSCCQEAGWKKRPMGPTMTKAVNILKAANVPVRKLSEEDDINLIGVSMTFVSVFDKDNAILALREVEIL